MLLGGIASFLAPKTTLLPKTPKTSHKQEKTVPQVQPTHHTARTGTSSGLGIAEVIRTLTHAASSSRTTQPCLESQIYMSQLARRSRQVCGRNPALESCIKAATAYAAGHMQSHLSEHRSLSVLCLSSLSTRDLIRD
jgi:hypothetical protein